MEDTSFDDVKSEQSFRDMGVESTRVKMNSHDIIKALEHDGNFFINFFLGDELEFPVPKFHIDCWNLLIHKLVFYIALAIPRGHAKTTLAKLVCVWYFLFTDSRFVIYLSNTSTVASAACKDIAEFMQSRNFEAVFGKIVFEVEQDQKGYYVFDLTLPHRLGPDGQPIVKHCILRAFGAGQQIRGMNIDNERPELAVCDDVEDDVNMATKELIRKLRTWFYGPFIKAMSKKNRKILFLGNMLSSHSLLYHFVKSDIWYVMRYGCILSTGKPLWPDMWSLEDIKSDFREYMELGMIGRWFAEMMNIPMPDSSPLCNAGDIRYSPEKSPDQIELGFITIDPAISLKTWADNTGIACHGMVADQWQIVEHMVGKVTPEQLFFLIVEMCKKWNIRVVGIEVAGYQASLKFLFEVLMHVHQFHFAVVELPHGNARKTDRLAAWVALIRKGIYSINDGDFAITEQLLKYDPTKKDNDDDLIDACAMGVPMIDYYMADIMDAYSNDNDMYSVKSDFKQLGV